MYLAQQIPEGTVYTEKEFSGLLRTLHTFGDPATLRRELFDPYLINRDLAGHTYTLNLDRPRAEDLLSKLKTLSAPSLSLTWKAFCCMLTASDMQMETPKWRIL